MGNGGNTVGSFSFSNFHLYRDFNYYMSEIERFWYGCRKEISFALYRLRDWLKELAPIFHPIRSNPENKRYSFARIFPRFGSVICNYYEFWLVHLIACVLCGFVVWHSTENRSIISYKIFIIEKRKKISLHLKYLEQNFQNVCVSVTTFLVFCSTCYITTTNIPHSRTYKIDTISYIKWKCIWRYI